ncbi:hypothetical protein SO694_00035163 [Aureococcus anophagefferens]|uniref:RRM domain-containing protein n=1 Tax=Aureococcus anophagefferens TaxID=44056 RepID=A0ABR1FKM4_AURAN
MRRRGASGAAALIILFARVVAEDYYGGDVIQGGHFMDDEMPLMDDECPDDSFDVRNRRRLHRGARGGARARARRAARRAAGPGLVRRARSAPRPGGARARARPGFAQAPVPSQGRALAVAREFVLSNAGDGAESCGAGGDDYGDVDAYGAFSARPRPRAEKATALAIVLLVIEHGAAPFDDPEVVALCRSLDPDARESLVSSLEEYFGDFYDARRRASSSGALRYALLSNEEKRAAMAEMSAHGYDALPEEASFLLERRSASFLLERLGGGASSRTTTPPRRRRRLPGSTPGRRRTRRGRRRNPRRASLGRRPARAVAAGVARARRRPPDVAASVKVLPVPPGATGGDLIAAFARYGGVVGARVDRGGVAYVDFATRNCAVAAAFDAHGRPLFAGGDAVSCIVRERSNSLDGPPPPAFPAFGGFGDGVQSDLRADAPAFGERPFAAEDDGLDRLPAGVL